MWWLRRYLPKSLLGRALTILAAPIILVQVIAIWIFFDNHVDAVTRNAARSLSGEIGLALTLIDSSTDTKQRAAAVELAERFLSINLTWRPGGKLGPAIRHTLVIARRNLLHIKSDPEQLVGMTIQPLMFLVLFVYVFGGAIAGSSREYLQFALPGILVQGVAFTGFQTALGLQFCSSRGT